MDQVFSPVFLVSQHYSQVDPVDLELVLLHQELAIEYHYLQDVFVVI